MVVVVSLSHARKPDRCHQKIAVEPFVAVVIDDNNDTTSALTRHRRKISPSLCEFLTARPAVVAAAAAVVVLALASQKIKLKEQQLVALSGRRPADGVASFLHVRGHLRRRARHPAAGDEITHGMRRNHSSFGWLANHQRVDATTLRRKPFDCRAHSALGRRRVNQLTCDCTINRATNCKHQLLPRVGEGER